MRVKRGDKVLFHITEKHVAIAIAIVVIAAALFAPALPTEPCDQACWHRQMCAQPRYQGLSECGR